MDHTTVKRRNWTADQRQVISTTMEMLADDKTGGRVGHQRAWVLTIADETELNDEEQRQKGVDDGEDAKGTGLHDAG
jgi:hypothetical protein